MDECSYAVKRICVKNRWVSVDYPLTTQLKEFFCHQRRTTDIPPPNLGLLKPTDMTIHWKALEEHFLMVPLVFQFNHLRGERGFSEFFSKNLSPSSVMLRWHSARFYGSYSRKRTPEYRCELPSTHQDGSHTITTIRIKVLPSIHWLVNAWVKVTQSNMAAPMVEGVLGTYGGYLCNPNIVPQISWGKCVSWGYSEAISAR
jgi:hypothetical protein